MSALKGLWRLKRGRQKEPVRMERCSSNQNTTSNETQVQNQKEQLPFRQRAKTFTDGVTKPRSKSRPSRSVDEISMLEDVQMTFTSPRHYLRRRALVESELQDDVNSSAIIKSANSPGSFDSVEENDSPAIHLDMDLEGHKISDSLQTMPAHTLYDIMEFLIMKYDIELKHDLKDYNITGTNTSGTVDVDLNKPSTDYKSCTIKVRATEELPSNGGALSKPIKETSDDDKEEREFHSVNDCLEYFNTHGLSEGSLSNHNDDDSYHLPRVAPLDPIPDEWEDLPIDLQAKNSLTDKELEQQRAIWELIHTEFSYLRTLETIINVFMRSLELIRRANFLTEDNYHNLFGYMEDLYHAHEQLWTFTFEPCLEKTNETGQPLDLDEIIARFPKSFGSHFQVYEQHCALDSLNISALNKAMSNPDFTTYLKWCEAHPECNRLQLKQLLAAPMQRLTRYTLLINAIAKKTTSAIDKESLEAIVKDITAFVHIVNNGIRVQEETERVKNAMNRITAYNVVDVPHELKEMVQSYTHLDLLAPMPGVELDKPRLLMVEGSLHYRDNIKQKMSPVYVFLFTDMLLITKPRRRGADKYSVIRPPLKITSLNINTLDSDSICCLVVGDYNVLSSWFILKAHSPNVAQEWSKQIIAAQEFYQSAMDKKAQTWKLMESLRSERILNGVESLDLLSASLSQSLWAINTLATSASSGRPGGNINGSRSKRASTPCFMGNQLRLTKTNSVDYHPSGLMKHAHRSVSGSVDFTNMQSLHNGYLSLENLSELNKRSLSSSECGMMPKSNLLNVAQVLNLKSAVSESKINERIPTGDDNNCDSVHMITRECNASVDQSWMRHPQPSPISDDGSTDSSGGSTSGYPRIFPLSSETDDTESNHSFTLPRATKGKQFADPRKGSSDSAYSADLSNHIENSTPKLSPHGLLETVSHPLKSILRRTPSPRKFEESTSPSPTSLKIPEDSKHEKKNDSDQVLFVPKNTIQGCRPKYYSAGCIEKPLIQKILSTACTSQSNEGLEVPPQYLQNDSSQRLALSSLVHARSLSESSIGSFMPPDKSWFDIVYVKDMNYSGSQKPNFESVKEEEEFNDSCTKKLVVNSDGDNLVLADVPLKPKVMFSDLTEIHSKPVLKSNVPKESEPEPASIEKRLPEKLESIPGWEVFKDPVVTIDFTDGEAVLNVDKPVLDRAVLNVNKLVLDRPVLNIDKPVLDRAISTASGIPANQIEESSTDDKVSLSGREKFVSSPSGEKDVCLPLKSLSGRRDSNSSPSSRKDSCSSLISDLSVFGKKDSTSSLKSFPGRRDSVLSLSSRKDSCSSLTESVILELQQITVEVASSFKAPPNKEPSHMNNIPSESTSQSSKVPDKHDPKSEKEKKQVPVPVVKSGKSVKELSKMFDKGELIVPLHTCMKRSSPNTAAQSTRKPGKRPPTNFTRSPVRAGATSLSSTAAVKTVPQATRRSFKRMSEIQKKKNPGSKLPPSDWKTQDKKRRLGHTIGPGALLIEEKRKIESPEQPGTKVFTREAPLRKSSRSSTYYLKRLNCQEFPKNKPPPSSSISKDQKKNAPISSTTNAKPTKPTPRRDFSIHTKTNLHSKQNGDPVSGKVSRVQHSNSTTDVPNSNNNNNNNNNDEEEAVTSWITNTMPPSEYRDEVDIDPRILCTNTNAHCNDNSQPIISVFRPRRLYSNNDFEKCSVIASSLGFHSKLRHHHSFGELFSTDSSKLKEKVSRSPSFYKSPLEWENFGSTHTLHSDSATQLSGHQWKKIS